MQLRRLITTARLSTGPHNTGNAAHTESHLKTKLEAEDIFQTCFVSLDKLLSRPWFRRIWVLQEVILAPYDKIDGPLVITFIGALRVLYHDLIEVVQASRHFSLYLPSSMRPIDTHRKLARNLKWFFDV